MTKENLQEIPAVYCDCFEIRTSEQLVRIRCKQQVFQDEQSLPSTSVVMTRQNGLELGALLVKVLSPRLKLVKKGKSKKKVKGEAK